jgi:hypothetical protein
MEARQKIENKIVQFCSTKWPTILWFTLAFASVFFKAIRGPERYNNYLIFKNVFWHTLQQKNLYASYPLEYLDTNHYGPVFSILIAPFACLPDVAGAILWTLFCNLLLFIAIRKLPISKLQQNVILLISAIEMATAATSTQFNPVVAAGIIFTYLYTKQNKTFWASFCIVLGFAVKLYGIVGLVFWLMSKEKLKFIGYCIFWAAILFVLPMAISSPNFIVTSYQNWFTSLVEKNSSNVNILTTNMQDISVMGLIKRIFNLPLLSNLSVIIPALLLYFAGLFNLRKYGSNINFQFLLLASTLLFVVLFSSGSESPTYIIALVGVALWYTVQVAPKNAAVLLLLAFVLLFTCLSATDAFPTYVKEHFIRPYAIKALPCFIVWLVVIYQMLSFHTLRLNKEIG